MDFVYGEVNEKAIKNTYKGLDSNTARVLVDNTNNTIQVIAHADTTGVQELIDESLSNIKATYSAPTGYIIKDITQTNGIISITFKKITNDDLDVVLPTSKISGLAPVATTGVYEDLSGKPDLNIYVEKDGDKQLSTNDFTNEDKAKLDDIESGAQVNTVLGVKGSNETIYRTGRISISKDNIGLSNVDNTSDINKPISNATQEALNDKLDRSVGALKSEIPNPYSIDNVNGYLQKATADLIYAQNDSLSQVAFDGDYNSLSNTPNLGEAAYKNISENINSESLDIPTAKQVYDFVGINSIYVGSTEPVNENVSFWYNINSGLLLVRNNDTWDVVGSKVSGVKGSNETTYHIGNISISSENVGAIPQPQLINDSLLFYNGTNWECKKIESLPYYSIEDHKLILN